MTDAGRRRRADEVRGAAPVDGVVVLGVTGEDARREMNDGVGPRDRRAQRLGPANVSLDDLAARSVEPRAQRIAGQHEPAYPPAVGHQPPNEPPTDLSRRTRDEDESPQRPPSGAWSADQSTFLKSPTASSREASSQITTVLPARRSSPPAIVSWRSRLVACAPASF